MRINDLSIKWKLLILCVFAICIPTVILGITSYRTHEVETYNAVRDNLRSMAGNWKIITESYIEQERRVLKREESLVKQRLEAILLDVIAILEIIVEEHGTDIPPDVLDEIYGKIASIRIGRSGYVSLIDRDDKYVISKNREYNAEDVFRTKAGTDDPDLQDTLKKTGKLTDNTTYFSASSQGKKDFDPRKMGIQASRYFEPLDLVVIVKIYNTDFKSYELDRRLKDELKYKMVEQKIGQNGYIWVINSNGEYVVSKHLLRDGENVWDARDENGIYITQEVIRGTKELGEGKTFIYRYFWKNIGEKEPQERLSASVYVPEWDWIIGASAYYEDFNKGLRTIRSHIIFISFISILVGSLFAYYFALLIAKPVRELEKISLKASNGDFNVDVGDIKYAKDEVGSLARAFNGMLVNIGSKQKELEKKAREEKVRSAELQKAYHELEEAQEKLVQSEKLAILGKMAGMVAHELRTPLGAIKGVSYFLRKMIEGGDVDLDKVDQHFKILDEEISMTDKIITDVLTFGRAKAPEREPSDISSLIEETLARLTFNEKIKVDLHLGKDLPKISADGFQVRQVLSNIILNAVQSMKNCGDLGVKTYFLNGKVVAEIKDNGPGIAEENMANIFEPLFSTKTMGTGLGLSICQKIMKQHEADIRVSSILGQGATFFLEFPAIVQGKR